MRDPVIAADGHTYDREAIEMWLRNHDTSPKVSDAEHFKSNLIHFSTDQPVYRRAPGLSDTGNTRDDDLDSDESRETTRYGNVSRKNSARQSAERDGCCALTALRRRRTCLFHLTIS